jgi:hypothetical protein
MVCGGGGALTQLKSSRWRAGPRCAAGRIRIQIDEKCPNLLLIKRKMSINPAAKSLDCKRLAKTEPMPYMYGMHDRIDAL